MEARRAGPLLTAVGLVVALAIVAVASRGSTPAAGPGVRRPSDTLLDLLFTLYLMLLVAGAILLVYMLVLRRLAPPPDQTVTSRLSLPVLGLLVLVAIAVTPRLRSVQLRAPDEEQEFAPVEPPDRPPGATVTQDPADPYRPDFAWIPALVLVGLVVAGVLAAWWANVRRRRARAGAETPTLGELLADVLEETLDDLRAERDPRRAVIAAYARLERVLAAHGHPRQASEAPLEYLGRLLRELSVDPESIRRLTLLFERAKFSQHAVGEAMKEEAIDALQRVQNELRAAEALAEAERERARALASERLRAAG